MDRIVLDRSKTLTELESDDWGEPGYASHLVITCHEMRHKPIADLTHGEVRMAIGQQFSLPILIPLAMERLAEDPLLEADFFEGDLLKFVFMVEPEFWTDHPDLWKQTDDLATAAFSAALQMDDAWHETIEPDFKTAYATFLERKPDADSQ
jgi:hypothetical protein